MASNQKRSFIKPRLLNYTDWFSKHHKMKILPSIRSPYAVTKLYAYWITVNYRKLMIYMLVMEFCLITITTASETFVTRKVTEVIKYARGEACLLMGNLDSMRLVRGHGDAVVNCTTRNADVT